MSNATNSTDTNAQAIVAGRTRSRTEKVMDQVTAWQNWIIVGALGAWVLSAAGVISLPTITDFHKILALGLVGGYIGSKVGIWPYVKDRVDSNKVDVLVAPAQGSVADIIRIPQDKFWKMDVIGGDFRQKVSLDGDIRFAARGLDLARDILVSAGDRPGDDDVPDDIQLIGSGADQMYNQLRGDVLEEYRRGTNRARDEQVLIEEAKRQVTNEYVELFESIRAGNIDMSDLDRSEAEKRADEAIRNLALKSADNGGDADE